MLVLKRKAPPGHELGRHDGNERSDRIFVNGGELIITVLGIEGGTVRLGFEADEAKYRVHREEVHHANERRRATGGRP